MTPDGSEQITCAVVTTGPNQLMRPIHDRMPVILNSADLSLWLDPKARQQDLLQTIAPYPADAMTAYPVSTAINNPRNDFAGVMEGA